MKNTIKYLIFLAVAFSFTFISCEKGEEGEEEFENGILYLKKVTDSKGEFAEFTYDKTNQLIEINSGPDDAMTMSYSYNDLGQMVEMNVEDVTGTNSSTVFNYDNEGDIISGTTTNEEFGANHTYQFNQGILESISVFADIPNIGSTILVKSEFTYSGDNVTEVKEYTLNFMTGNLSLSKKISYEYDKFKNPYYDLAVKYSVINEGYEQFASKNNAVKRTVELNSTGYSDDIGSYEISYDYNSNNYPISDSDGTVFTYY